MRDIPEYYAGNKLTVDRTFTRTEGQTQSVNPSTAKAWVEAPDGTESLLADPVITYPEDGVSKVTATATWTPPLGSTQGLYFIHFYVTGNLVGRTKAPVFIIKAGPVPT